MSARVYTDYSCRKYATACGPLGQVYALEIQMCTETKNNKKLQQLYQKAVQVSRVGR